MVKIQFSQQSRIISLIILLSLILIVTFTFIQINNQLTNITRYNSYQANLSTMIVKNNLEVAAKESTPETIEKNIQSTVKSLIDANVIKDIVVYNSEGKIVASSDSAIKGDIVSYVDLNKVDQLKRMSDKNNWYIYELDKPNQCIAIYIAINKTADLIPFVAKITITLANIWQALSEIYQPIFITIIVVVIIIVIFGYILSKTIVGPIRILNNVTKIIAAGDLSVRTNIKTADELEELGETFNFMAQELSKMKERAENANPLTKLPGNIVIQEEIEKRINNNSKFMIIYCDLDNFKAFNDKYGLSRGDDAIKLTAEIFRDAIKSKGSSDDFIGHSGGDDFIIVASLEKSDDIANYIITEFNQRIRALYNEEDLQRGYIVAKSRDNTIKQFPIMSISLAGVTNKERQISNYAEITNIAAEVKKKAKSIGHSVFVVDKRLGD